MEGWTAVSGVVEVRAFYIKMGDKSTIRGTQSQRLIAAYRKYSSGVKYLCQQPWNHASWMLFQAWKDGRD